MWFADCSLEVIIALQGVAAGSVSPVSTGPLVFLLAWCRQLVPVLSGSSGNADKHTEHTLAGDMSHVKTFNNYTPQDAK